MRMHPLIHLAVAIMSVVGALVWVAWPQTSMGPGPGTAPDVPGRHCLSAAPSTASEWEELFAGLGDAWLGGDGSISVPVGQGRTLWLFGDTLVRVGAGGLAGPPRMVRSSAVLVDGACATVVRPGQEFLPIMPVARATGMAPDRWWWPMSAVVTEAGPGGADVTVFLQRVERTGPTAWSFRTTGLGRARFTVVAGGEPGPVVVTPYRTSPRDGTDHGVRWGAAAAVTGGSVAVFGTRATGRPLEFGRELLLARAPRDRLADTRSWRYWDGRGWATEPATAVVLHPAVGGVSTALSATVGHGRWTLVTKADEVFGDRVVSLTATAPWGPFTERTLFLSPSRSDDLTYLALAHPEVSAAGRLLVSINHNVADLTVVVADPRRYRPSFHDVPAPR